MLKTSKVTRCVKCRRLLCKRKNVHLGSDESKVVEVQHKGIKVISFDCVIKCPACGSCYRVNGEDGIVGKEIQDL